MLWAQVSDQEVERLCDSLYKDKSYYQYLTRNDDTGKAAAIKSYERLYDSVEYALVNRYIQTDFVANDVFTWPLRARKSAVVHDDTYWYLIKHRYNISEALYTGCVDEHYLACYDSLMNIAICRKYGADFFERVEREANELNAGGQGLLLPYINGRKDEELEMVKAALPAFWDSLTAANDGWTLLINIEFREGKIVAAGPATSFLGNINYIPEVHLYEKAVLNTMQKFDWQGPLFKQKPVVINVILDFNNKNIYFDD